jgi:hypothetical protein
MPTSVYFNNYNSHAEQRLYEDLIGEVVHTYGIDAKYIPRESESSFDLVFGDDPTKKYDSSYPIAVYVQNVDGFQGGDLFSKFGLEIRKQVQFVIPHRAFKQGIPQNLLRPREGDLLWLTNFKNLFEITFVERDNFFYTFGRSSYYGFLVTCELFRYSNEDLATGDPEVDVIENELSSAFKYTMTAGGTSTYALNEQVYQGTSLNAATAIGYVARWDKPTLSLELKDVKGRFATGSAIVGVESGASYVLSSTNLFDNTNDGLENNFDFESEADGGILDFTESNPFGEP